MKGSDRCAALLACAIAWIGFVETAAADVIAPNPPKDACNGKTAGDACDVDGKSGACKATKCQRRVGGVLNPSVIEEDCLLCDPSAQPTKAEEPTPTPTPTKVDPPAKDVAPTKDVVPTKDAAPTKSAAVEDASKTSVCNVTADPTPTASFVLGIALLLLARGRRCA